MSADSANRSLKQVKNQLTSLFSKKISLKDISTNNETLREDHFLARALAALYLTSEVNLNVREAAGYVTDGENDNGIDAVYFDEQTNTLHVVQSKWRHNPKKGVKLDEIVKFREGVEDIINSNFRHVNDKVARYKSLINRALDDINVSVVMTLIHTSENYLHEDTQEKINSFLKKQNEFTDEFLSFQEFGLKEVFDRTREQTRPENIDIEVLLNQWGRVESPYEAFFGLVSGQEIANWHRRYGSRLFAENLRFILEKSEVNDAMLDTIKERPSSFWYFNNGITAICNSIGKKPLGGTNRDSGVFDVRGISIINGAQTVGSISRAADTSSVDDIKIQMRIISLQNTPQDFARDVTRANNTQNDLTSMDFASLDEQQERLRQELSDLGVIYTYRRGQITPEPNNGFDLRAATIALACYQSDLRLAVYAKRYISALWEDIDKPPYTQLFNDKLSGRFLWRLVQIMRGVDEFLDEAAANSSGRNRLIAVHGNRFILHCVFNNTDLSKMGQKRYPVQRIVRKCKGVADDILQILREEINDRYPDSYPGNIFKNQERQRELRERIYQKYK